VLRFGDEKFLIDCGEGTQNRCMEYGINFQKISHIFISHLHGDHFLGLFGMINTMNLLSRKKPLTIYTTQGLKNLLDLHYSTCNLVLHFDVEVIEIIPDFQIVYESATIKVTAMPLEHRIPCIGWLFEEKRGERKLNYEQCKKLGIPFKAFASIKNGADFKTDNGTLFPNEELTFEPRETLRYAYITDTLVQPQLKKQISGVNLLYHEATFLHNLESRAHETFHSTGKEAAIFAAQAKVGRLIVGHFSSRYKDLEAHIEECRSQFPNSDVAIEGSVFPIK
jgi:ribonuclease Z